MQHSANDNVRQRKGSQRLKLLRSCRSGVAYIEFAYSIPIFMLLCMYGIELANIAITNARVSSITSMMADGAARVRDRIDETDLLELFIGAKATGQGIDLTKNGRIIISTVEDNAATAATDDQVITWQRCKGLKVPNGAEIYGTEGSVLTGGIGTTGRKIVATPGNPVIFAEIIYNYKPIITDKFFGPITMHYSSAFSVRDRVVQTMQNGSGMASTARAMCAYYNE